MQHRLAQKTAIIAAAARQVHSRQNAHLQCGDSGGQSHRQDATEAHGPAPCTGTEVIHGFAQLEGGRLGEGEAAKGVARNQYAIVDCVNSLYRQCGHGMPYTLHVQEKPRSESRCVSFAPYAMAKEISNFLRFKPFLKRDGPRAQSGSLADPNLPPYQAAGKVSAKRATCTACYPGRLMKSLFTALKAGDLA